MSELLYKGFNITTRVEATHKARREVVVEAYPIEEKTITHSWIVNEKFESDEAAHEFGFQIARDWIDEHET